MTNLLHTPPSPHGHQYYEMAQLAAFAVYVALLLGQGYQRGYPWRSWLPLVAATTLALMLGCQLVFLPLADWLPWLRGDAALVQAVAWGPRSVVGGAAASLAAVLLLRRALGFRGWAVLDAFAGPLCWALAVQSVGCVLVGCCWGQVAASGWGLSYGPGTHAYTAQVAQGLVAAGAARTLPLVPTQLYQLLLCAGTGGLLHLVRHRAARWPGGSRYLLGTGLLCLGRLVVEHWRDPAGEPLLPAPLALAGISLLGLQWLLLLEAALLLGGWAWLLGRPLRGGAAPAAGRPVTPAGAPLLVCLGLLGLTARLAPTTLSLPEIAVLQALLLAALLAEGFPWLLRLGYDVPRLARAPLGLLLGGALLLATAQAPAPRRGAPDRQLTFSAGSLRNQYDERPSGGCTSSPNTYSHRNRAGGAEVAYQWAPDSARHTFNTVGGGVWAGSEDVDLQAATGGSTGGTPSPYVANYSLYDIHVYVENHRVRPSRRINAYYRVGLHLGELAHAADGTTASTTSVLPELMLAIGNRRTVFGQADFGYGAENALGNYTSRLALGSGLGQHYGSTVLLGYAAGPHYPSSSMGFISANLRAPASSALSGLSLEPYLATDFGRHQVFSLKLHYQLALKPR